MPEDPLAAFPPIGSDTRDVLAAAGYAAGEIEQLIADGTVAVA